MPPKGFRTLTVKESVCRELQEVAKRDFRSVPRTVKRLAALDKELGKAEKKGVTSE